MSTLVTPARRRCRTDAAADYLGLAKSTLEKKRLDGSGPKYIKAGRSVIYDTADLDDWLDANRRLSTSVADVKNGHEGNLLTAVPKPERRPITTGGAKRRVSIEKFVEKPPSRSER